MARFRRKLLVNGEAHARRHPLEGDAVKLSTFVPITFRQRGQRKVAIAPPGVEAPVTMGALAPALPVIHDPTLLKALGKGFYWQQLIDTGKVADATEIAKREGVHRATVNELLRLALLAPSIIEAALAGRLGVQLEVAVATNRCSNVAMGRLPKLSIPTPLRRLTKTSLIHWQVPSVLRYGPPQAASRCVRSPHPRHPPTAAARAPR
jgi:hypothetical protein